MFSPHLERVSKSWWSRRAYYPLLRYRIEHPTLHWAMSSSDSIKEYDSNAFPYVKFTGWTGADSIQAYVDRLKEQLPSDESRRQVDTLIPSVAVEMLHKRLTGRFRPIVTAIEVILKIGKWDIAIDKTETMTTSWMDREHRGNLCGEVNW